MQSHCPHCDALVDVPNRQSDVLCPNCQRFFLWTPISDKPFSSERSHQQNESESDANSQSHFDQELFKKNLEQKREDNDNSGENPQSGAPADHANERPHSIGLYSDYTIQQSSNKQRRPVSKKTGKNMYPYELPGQVVEADRRMPVYSSMMFDAFTILCAHVGTMLTAVIFFGVMMGGLVIGSAIVYFALAQAIDSVSMKMALFLMVFMLASVGYVWIFNGQRQYVISLIRQGKTSTTLLFSGSFGLFRNFVVFWIHFFPLIIPLMVGYCYYFWFASNGNLEFVESNLGIFYFVFQQTPGAVALAGSIIGFCIFLVILLNWGLAFWLIIDKDLGIAEGLDVSHKITYEKKATFLGVLTSSIGIVVVLSCLTLGIASLLFPIALLFVGMYYMKTAIQEMVIPGKTSLGAHSSLYGTNAELSDQSDEEEDIL